MDWDRMGMAWNELVKQMEGRELEAKFIPTKPIAHLKKHRKG